MGFQNGLPVQLLAGSLISSPHGFSVGSLIILLTWELASPEWLLQDRARRKPTASSVLILQVTHNDCCHMLFIEASHQVQHTLGEELGFTFNGRRSIKEYVDICKTTTGHIREVVCILLLLGPHWLELSHMATHSPGGAGMYRLYCSGCTPNPKLLVYYYGKGMGQKFSFCLKRSKNADVSGEKKNLVAYNLHSRRGKICFSSVACFLMFVTYG